MGVQQTKRLMDIFGSWAEDGVQLTYFEKQKEISAQKYENAISWSFQVMDNLKIKNTTKALIKVYLDKVFKASCLQSVRQYKLLNLIAFQTALRVNGGQNQQLLKTIQIITNNVFSDQQLANTKIIFLELLNFETKFQTPFTHLHFLSDVPQYSTQSLFGKLVDIVNISHLCYQLINFKPKIVAIACIKYLLHNNSQLNQILENSLKTLFEQSEVLRAFSILNGFIGQEQQL